MLCRLNERAEIVSAPPSSKHFSAVKWNVFSQILDFCYMQNLLLTCRVSPQFTSFDRSPWERHFCCRVVFLLGASTLKHSARPLIQIPSTQPRGSGLFQLNRCVVVVFFLLVPEHLQDKKIGLDPPPASLTPSLCYSYISSCKPDCLSIYKENS